jgi:capsular polysaccharide transport system ATP-binding protein
VIILENVSKTYRVRDQRNIVLDNINLTFPLGINIGILGRNGAGKSTMMRIIGGSELPDSGRVIRKGRVSWPIGFSGGFHGSLTGRENLRFTCRIYGALIDEVTDFVDDFAGLGRYMDMPLKTYSSGMRSKLAFGLSMAIGFDYYLIDEVTAVGDAAFKKKCEATFNARKTSSTLIVVSHSIATIKKHCDVAAVLDKGQLLFFDDIDKAIRCYHDVCNTGT